MELEDAAAELPGVHVPAVVLVQEREHVLAVAQARLAEARQRVREDLRQPAVQ